MDKCPYCGAEIRPGDNCYLNCGNRLLPATPSLGDTPIPGSNNWSTPLAPPSPPLASEVSDRPLVESPAVGGDTLPTVQATLNTIENPARFIVCDDKGNVLQEHHVEKYETVIGRAPTSDILLPKDKLTSRRHAVVRYRESNYVLIDERSTNGTFVNGQRAPIP